MEALQPVESDDAIEVDNNSLVSFPGGCIIAGGKGMAGIETDAATAGKSRAFDDGLQLFEGIAEIRPLAGSRLQKDRAAELRHGGKEFIQCSGDPSDAHRLVISEVRARMHDDLRNTEQRAPFHLIPE